MSSLIQGFVIGIANIIPGVSGGTLALVLGIYERLLTALTQWTRPALLQATFAVILFRKGSIGRLIQQLRESDQFFLARIGLGAVAAILAASRLMAFVLRDYPGNAYAFFFGLVLFSMIFPYRALRRRSFRELFFFLAATAATVLLLLSVNEDKQLEKAERKHELAVAKTEQAAQAATPESAATFHAFSFESPGPRALTFIFFAAALAISAMILPGISGSFVLLLLGVYFDILLAINERQILVLAVFALGAGAGLLVFSGVLSFLMRKAYDATLSAMIGLMAGSLFGIWPFKKIARVGDESVLLGNLMPDTWGRTEWMTLIWAGLGAALILGSFLLERRLKPKPTD